MLWILYRLFQIGGLIFFAYCGLVLLMRQVPKRKQPVKMGEEGAGKPQTKACPHCGVMNKAAETICSYCGKPFEPGDIKCPKCKAENDPDAEKCWRCSEALPASIRKTAGVAAMIRRGGGRDAATEKETYQLPQAKASFALGFAFVYIMVIGLVSIGMAVYDRGKEDVERIYELSRQKAGLNIPRDILGTWDVRGAEQRPMVMEFKEGGEFLLGENGQDGKGRYRLEESGVIIEFEEGQRGATWEFEDIMIYRRVELRLFQNVGGERIQYDGVKQTEEDQGGNGGQRGETEEMDDRGEKSRRSRPDAI